MTIDRIVEEPVIKKPFYFRQAKVPKDTNFMNVTHGELGDVYMDFGLYNPFNRMVMPIHSRLIMLPTFLRNLISSAEENVLLYEEKFGKLERDTATEVDVDPDAEASVPGLVGKGEYTNFAYIAHNKEEFIVQCAVSAFGMNETFYHTTLRFSPGDFKMTTLKAYEHLQKHFPALVKAERR